MKTLDMRALPAEELSTRIAEWQEEAFRAKCNQTVGQLTNTMELRQLRRTIARAKTLVNEQLRTEKAADGAE